ncbi:MAG TPA: gamma-glutamyl-gamma-aminobutyrate hydrolase family protein [Solirubrobacterales bacterium]|jgi:putative glutamine amidotransferase|nr:gamma-glutamyl-gamma-aminobutyrate hydrolase family protein [Solirubrobacterales bacterium]
MSSADAAPLIGVSGSRLLAARVRGMHPVLLDATIDSYFSDFAKGVARAGGVPVQLSASAFQISPSVAAAAVERLDGLVLAGGEDIDPRRYGRRPSSDVGPHDTLRDEFELALISAALARDIPILGICRGLQLLNVISGGTLIADLGARDEFEEHLPIYPAATRVQTVTFTPGSLAAQVFGDELDVNSFHHQAVDEAGKGVEIVGRSADGVVEAIEMPGREVLGVQWHPELYRAADPAFDWVVAAAAGRWEATAGSATDRVPVGS